MAYELPPNVVAQIRAQAVRDYRPDPERWARVAGILVGMSRTADVQKQAA